jgi:CheY-like chemotaxis protein
MKSTKDLLHQIQDTKLSTNERAQLRCQLAKQLEEVGNYESAREALNDLWRNVGDPPKLEGLDQRTAAEVLLRVGTLTGWLGSIRQIQGAQEAAKDLLSESITIFQSLHEPKKVAEAQTEIAVCYKRQGALDDARVMFTEALTHLDDQDGDLKAVTLLRSAVLEQIANRLNDALHILRTALPLFDASQSDTLKGRFHNEYANVLRDLGVIESRPDYVDLALIEYSAASFHFNQAGHSRYQACVENNLGFLFGMIRNFVQAHEHLDRAQALFTRLNDNVHLAQVEETRARVMLSEGAIPKAAQIANNAVRMLETADQPSLLAEALITYGTALARLRNHQQARAVFERAITIAEHAGDLETSGIAALTLFEELTQHLSENDICELLQRAYDVLRATKDTATRTRLTDCAFRALSIIHTLRPDWTTFSLEQTIHRHEARYIQMALEDSAGNISQAARLLGMRRHTNLHYLLKGPHKDIVPTATSELAADDKLQTIKILHIEDDLTIAGIVQELADHEGWDVKHCVGGNEGLTELSGVAHYDLLLVDHQLPGLNGLELIGRVRAMVHRRYLPIIMMSGTLDERTARDAGADAFLRKPQDIGLIVQTIDRLLDPDQHQGT